MVTAGSITITKLRVIENTGECRQGKWHPHPTPTTHFVEAKFELGDNTAANLHTGDSVIVVGEEHTASWGDDDNKQYGRVVDARVIGVDLTRAVGQVRRTTKADDLS